MRQSELANTYRNDKMRQSELANTYRNDKMRQSELANMLFIFKETFKNYFFECFLSIK